jgi:hypothetical protein
MVKLLACERAVVNAMLAIWPLGHVSPWHKEMMSVWSMAETVTAMMSGTHPDVRPVIPANAPRDPERHREIKQIAVIAARYVCGVHGIPWKEEERKCLAEEKS